jgi:hypothetical protein
VRKDKVEYHDDVKTWNGIPCDCGLSHAKETRLRILRRMLPATTFEIRDAYPCIWRTSGKTRLQHVPAEPPRPKKSVQIREQAGECALLYRDLHDLGAVCLPGVMGKLWCMPEQLPESAKKRAKDPLRTLLEMSDPPGTLPP